jgi:membrane-bound lytic murein transglycosylase D
VAQLRRWNGLRSSYLIYPGQRLVVSAAGAADGSAIARSDAPSRGASTQGDSKGVGGRTHVVRRGESLWRIARRYGVKLDDIMSWNGLLRSSTLQIGQKLVIR